MPRTLKKGDKGEDVRRVQQVLNLHLDAYEGYPRLDPDGDFGNLTDGRVREFQTLNGLDPDGKVGYFTREKLLEARCVNASFEGRPLYDRKGSGRVPAPAFAAARGVAPALVGAHAGSVAPRRLGGVTPVGDPSPPNTVTRNVQLQAGQQIAINPWLYSPMVLTAQFNWLVKNNGKPDFQLTAGTQVALNENTFPAEAGRWSAQGFAQMGLSGLSTLFKAQGFDLANPFVVVMLQKSERPRPFSVGLGIGNQLNWHLLPDETLTAFVNGQAVTNVSLGNGQGSAPGLQILGGITYTIKWPGEKR